MIPDFAKVLSDYIHEKNVNVYSMAQFCDLDRSTMYKFINGKRRPSSISLVRKMADFMLLTPAEYQLLSEAYRISLVGPEIYFRRKYIWKFLQNPGKYISALPVNFTKTGAHSTPPPLAEMTVLDGQSQITNCMFEILAQEAQEEQGKIQIFMDPDFSSIIDYLASLGCRNHSLQIEHIFCMDNTQQLMDNGQNYNLYCLEQILPLYTCGCLYNAYYFYDTMFTRKNTLEIFSVMLITSRYALLFTRDRSQGILFGNRASVQLYRNIFGRFYPSVSSFADKVTDVISQIQRLISFDFGEKDIYIFQPLPCLTYCLPEEFLDRYLYPDLPGREHVLGMLSDFIRRTKDSFSERRPYFLFTEQGVLDFLETGRVPDYPDYVYAPFSIRDRMFLIQEIMKKCLPQQLCMLKKNYFYSNRSISIFSSPHSGYLFLPVMETGRVPDYPDYVYAPFSIRDRMFLIQEIMKKCLPQQLCMLKKNYFYSNRSISIFSSPHSGYLFLPVCNEADSCEQIYLDITESHLVSSFYDFLLYLKENFCYSPDETGKVLRRILQEFHTRV